MKKKYLFLLILLVLVFIPFQLQAQSAESSSMDVFQQDGIASWYGREFEGRPTASGEIFDSSQLTAAHPSLPFGTRLIVTNQHNNKSVTVRVNDRGPFVPARIIDVSRAAAEQLDMIVTGTAPVSVVSIDRIIISTPAVGAQAAPSVLPVAPVIIVPQTQPVSAPVFTSQPVVVQMPYEPQDVRSQLKLTPELSIAPNKNYRFQVGSFRNARNAVDAFDRLKNSGLNPAYERFTNSDNIEYYRVVIAGVSGVSVQSTAEKISAAGFREAIIREEN
ncbi:MAG: septal ring lytic transglycosylase RlpA family protein [Treponema sp.]|nr:septal ring lytic transglycosylase RlpA family protein [Treponema sp.]